MALLELDPTLKKIVFEDSKQLLKVFSSAIMLMTKDEALFIIVLSDPSCS